MSEERYRTREAVKQQGRAPVRPGGTSRSTSGQGGDPPGEGAKPEGTKRRGLLYGILGAVAVAAAGAAVLVPHGGGGSAAGGGFEFTVITDPQQVIGYLHQQHLPPAREEQLEEKAKQEELVVWHISQLPGWSQQQGQAYTMDNGTDHYQFTINSNGQEFGVFAEKSTTGFNFSADSNPGNAKMTGTWSTPAGRTPFNMQVGQTIVVKVK